MPLVNMSEMLVKARKERYAVGAFNILDYTSMRAVILAASELESPVIVQTSEKTVHFWGFKSIISWISELETISNIPVAIHLDHCKDLDLISRCIDEGWTSVMIDASSFPFEKNMELTEKVVRMAHPHQVSVEAELGEIGGVEDDIIVDEASAHLASPEKARIFLESVDVDCFAPAIGTAHGIYKGKPKIAFDRLAEIAEMTDIPLALHGGTGLSVDDFNKCISFGCAKINISTQLKYAFVDGFIQYFQAKPSEYNPLKLIEAQSLALKSAVKENIAIFGSTNKI